MKTVLITGASRGIGRATTLALAEENTSFDRLVLVGRAGAAFEETAAQAKALGRGKELSLIHI